MNTVKLTLLGLILCPILLGAGCQKAAPDDAPAARKAKPVEGRTSTGAGVSFDFPAGWSQVSVTGPFNVQYANKEKALEMGVATSPLHGVSAATALAAVREHIAAGATVIESDDAQIDGRPGLRLLVDRKTASGHNYGGVVAAVDGSEKLTAAYVSAVGDSYEGQLDLVKGLLGTAKFER